MLLTFLLAAFAAPQGEVRVSASVEPDSAPAGATVELKVQMDLMMGYHVYHPDQDPASGIPVSVKFSGEAFSTAGELSVSKEPVLHELVIGASTLKYLWLEGSPVFTLPLKVDGPVGATTLTANIGWQVCDDSVCFPATGKSLSLNFEIVEGAAVAPEAPVDPLPAVEPGNSSASADGTQLESTTEAAGGLWAFILAAIAGGIFALLMPCTYPMIPITISFFTKQAEIRGGKVLSLSLAYGAGIVGIFVLIGVVVGPIILAFATHPVTNLVIGGLFLVFALALFGLIQLNPPQFLMRTVGSASKQGGYFGVFLMGATLVVASFTCTAPFVGSLLSFGASVGGVGGVGKVALGMGVFGLTMAVPFVFLALAPGRLQKLPQSGMWMDTLKFTLGFVEVAAALKFISNADVIWRQLDGPVMGIEWGFLSRERFLLLWTVIFFVAAVFLFGWLPGKRLGRPGPGRFVSALTMAAFAIYCGYGYQGGRLGTIMTAIAPNYTIHAHLEAKHEIIVDDLKAAKAKALADGKLVLVNFTGHT